jgi:hypothetical protein
VGFEHLQKLQPFF